jgi:hypothetical protein
MNSWKFFFALFARVFIVIITLAFTFIYWNGYLYSAILILVFFFWSVPKCIRTLKTNWFYDKTILSILNNDFSASFPAGYKEGDYKNLCLLYDTLKRNNTTWVQRINLSLDNKQYRHGCFNFRKENDTGPFSWWTIVFQLFSASKVTNWDYLKITCRHFAKLKIPVLTIKDEH